MKMEEMNEVSEEALEKSATKKVKGIFFFMILKFNSGKKDLIFLVNFVFDGKIFLLQPR